MEKIKIEALSKYVKTLNLGKIKIPDGIITGVAFEIIEEESFLFIADADSRIYVVDIDRITKAEFL